MSVRNTNEIFELLLAPHMDSAFNLARWLARNDHDAADIVQESCLRALRFSAGFSGDRPREWFLRIVRNTAYTMLKDRNVHAAAPLESISPPADSEQNPERLVLRDIDIARLRTEIEALPEDFREVIVLREFEELSYEEIARIAGVPIGTVMSRLARARGRLQERLTRDDREAPDPRARAASPKKEG
jgi:RNA polymerase sigma-70 factor (ECF subfamily)